MSHVATSWAYRQSIPSAGRKFVLVALADFADEAWSCYPGQDRLATMTGQSTRSVRSHLAQLEADGLIARQPRFQANGQRTSDRYRLLAGVIESVQPPADIAAGKTRLRKATTAPPADLAGDPLENRQGTPPPPASGGGDVDHCQRHVRHRRTCPDCLTASAALTAKPAWCGGCDERTRLLDGDVVERCPDCHPLSERTTA